MKIVNFILIVPHHSVLKSNNITSKLRAVFDASSRCSINIFLNDCLLTGLKLKQEFLSNYLHLDAIVFTADTKIIVSKR